MTTKTPSCCSHKQVPFYKKKLFIVFVVLFIVLLISYLDYFKVLEHFRHSFLKYLNIVWIPVLIGLVLSGFIEVFVPHKYITKILTEKNKYSIFHSALLGFLMSACNHGILAISIQLYKKGASIPEIITFLLASPWANLPLTILFFSFFGILKGFYIIFCAILVAISTGYIFKMLIRKNMIEKNPNTMDYEENFSIIKEIKTKFTDYNFTKANLVLDTKAVIKGSLEMSDMILWWLLIGVIISSVISAYVPQNIFDNHFNASISGLGLTLLGATLIEVCSEGSAAISFELFTRTGALGNSFVFLMAGVVTDYTEIGLLWMNIGRKTAIWLPIVTVPQVIVLGYLANIIF